MGAPLPFITMRAVVYFGLFVLAVAVISETEAISFDELVARADEAEHPKPKPKPKRVDPEMEEWSTDHLLGLDEPPPADMFASLEHEEEEEKPAKKVHVEKKAPK